VTSVLQPINDSTSPGIFRWQPASWLRVSGEDAANFLQGQFTNELRGLAPRSAVYGLWLSLKGKVIADSFIVGAETATDNRTKGPAATNEAGNAAAQFWIGSYFSPGAVIHERLESHVIADDVIIEDQTDAWVGLSVWGSVNAAELPPGVVLFSGRRSREPNLEIVFPRAIEATVRARLGPLLEIDATEMARRRIAAGIPAVPVDVGPNDLPNEAGLETAAISYTKGCYLGQEVMARLKSMGQVRRRLLRVGGVFGTLPTLPAPLFAGARQVGEWRSAAPDGEGGVIGLAMLSLMHVPAGAKLALAANGPAVLTSVDTP
jgi:tRNA-modifying protein YgfZ